MRLLIAFMLLGSALACGVASMVTYPSEATTPLVWALYVCLAGGIALTVWDTWSGKKSEATEEARKEETDDNAS